MAGVGGHWGMKSGKMQFLRTRAESLRCLTWSNREGLTERQRGALAEEKVPEQSKEKGPDDMEARLNPWMFPFHPTPGRCSTGALHR